MNLRNIFLYWIGKEYNLILILRDLIYLHSKSGKGYNIILITEKNINEYITNIPDYFYKLCPAHQADFVRVNVICDYGGIWLDSDIIVMQELDSLFDLIDNQNGFFIKENNELLCIGVFGSKKNTQLMQNWKNNLINILDKKKQNIKWCELGSNILENINKLNPEFYINYKIFNGLDNMYPVNWNNCIEEFINKPYENYNNIIREFQPIVVLVNSVYKNLENKTIKEITEGDNSISYFINKSLENFNIKKQKIYSDENILVYKNNDYISNSIIDYQCWEPNISNIFETIIKNNNNNDNTYDIIDIGCNLGYFSLVSAKKTNINKIYSIDGNINNINILNINIKINNINNIHTFNLCISDKTGKTYEPENKEFAYKIGNIGGLKFMESNNLNHELVSSITIDDLIKQNNIKNILIMKIDIEGGELNALKGAINSIKSKIIKNIIIEISPKFNNDSYEILKLLFINNYEIFNIPNYECGNYNLDDAFLKNLKKVSLINIKNFISSIGNQTNILAIKKYNFVIITDWIIKYITKEHFMFAKNLEKLGWKIIKLSDLNIEKIKKQIGIVLCITYDDFDISQLKCDNLFVIYKIDDLFPYKQIRHTCINNANMIIGPYQYLFNTDKIINIYPNINNVKNYKISYSAVNEFYSNIEFNYNPIKKILVSGAMNDCYPLRKVIANKIETQNNIDILQHPGYNINIYENNSNAIVNEKYYNKLNEYLCCFTDTLSFDYILLKIFEICSVGSLLLVQDSIYKELNNLGLYDEINCIMCNINNIDLKIDWILDENNRQTVDNIRNNGMNLVRNKHNTYERALEFTKLFNINI
jgi:FkbM family methyltransferase